MTITHITTYYIYYSEQNLYSSSLKWDNNTHLEGLVRLSEATSVCHGYFAIFPTRNKAYFSWVKLLITYISLPGLVF